MSVFELELKIFKLINQVWTHPKLDSIFVFITELDKTWMLPAAALAVFIFIWHLKGRVVTIKSVMAILISVTASDLISYRLIKPLVNRPRPSHVSEANAIVRINGKGGYHGFTSNHAANSFAYAYVLANVFPQGKLLIYGFAAIVAYSRVYVGVHFLGDVVVGSLLGLLLASMIVFLLNQFERRVLRPKYKKIKIN